MNKHTDALVSISQTVLRFRGGTTDNLTSEMVEATVNECEPLVGGCYGDRLAAIVEICRRYDLKAQP